MAAEDNIYQACGKDKIYRGRILTRKGTSLSKSVTAFLA
jgi:hypothetical protein